MSDIPKQIRNYIMEMTDLKELGEPKYVPQWLTPKYIAECMDNEQLQKNWKPKRGDWYLCLDMCQLLQVDYEDNSLQKENNIQIVKLLGCDIYIPNPNEKEMLNEKQSL